MKRNSINVGIASLILVFMIMCLSCVTLLTLSISNKDLQSTYRIGDRVQLYYNADTEANRYIEKVYCVLINSLERYTTDPEQYISEELGEDWLSDEHCVVKRFSLSEYQELYVKLKFDWEDNVGIEVLDWRVCDKGVLEINQSMGVIIFDE